MHRTQSAPPPQRRAYWLASLGPFLILAIVAGVLLANWSRIPPRFAVHWSAHGVPNGWVTRSFWGVFGFLLIPAVFCLLIVLLGYATLHWAQHSQGATSSDHRRGTAWMMLGASYLLAIVYGLTALLPLRGVEHAPALWPLLAAVLVPLAVAVMLVLTWKAKPKPHPTAQVPRERSHEGHWVAGFYYNPDDPAILVPKRFGYGYTFNLAQRRAWLLLGAIGVAITIALVLSAASH